MAEVEGIDMFIVFADVLRDGSDGGARSDIGSMITSSPSVYIGSRPSSAPAPTLSRSTPGAAASRSVRTGGRSGQEANSGRRFRQVHSARSAQTERHEEFAFSAELPPPQGVFRRESVRREGREESSGPTASTNSASHGNNVDLTAHSSFDTQGGTFVSRFLSSIPVSSRPQTWTQVHSSMGMPSPTTASANPTQQQGSRTMPAGLEQILQRAFSQISGESMMTEFMRRILESQRRGNPPASRFAIDNLEGSTNLLCQTCTICQDDICKGCEAIHMPCKHAFHRECLVPWLQEHNTCPICRCEIESHCPRYNQSNFDKLKGPLQPITVTNHEDPSRLAPPAGAGPSIGLGGAHSSGSSHVRMTIRMPYPTPQLFDRSETSGARAEAAARPGVEPTARPPTRYVRPSLLRHTPASSHQPSTVGASASSARARTVGLAGNGNEDVEDAPAPKRRRQNDAESARALEEVPAVPSPSNVHECRMTFEDAPAAPHSQARRRRVTFEDPPAAAPPRVRRGSKRERAVAERGTGADVLEVHRDDTPIAARTRTRGQRQE
mmetsp:Transcript_7556/g.16232  ORF Transcript_7556/g.16232 Transcript_7556/m.16232 type:complete len:552 (-) Transcript_7556:377-2032(-)